MIKRVSEHEQLTRSSTSLIGSLTNEKFDVYLFDPNDDHLNGDDRANEWRRVMMI